jgi:hypothetical protein
MSDQWRNFKRDDRVQVSPTAGDKDYQGMVGDFLRYSRPTGFAVVQLDSPPVHLLQNGQNKPVYLMPEDLVLIGLPDETLARSDGLEADQAPSASPRGEKTPGGASSSNTSSHSGGPYIYGAF